MRRICGYILIIILTFNFVVFNFVSISRAFNIPAGIAQEAAREGPNIPPKDPKPDAPQNPIDPGGETKEITTIPVTLRQKHGDVSIPVPYYNGIKGNAFEDLGKDFLTREGKEKLKKENIQYIRVDLIGEDGQIKDTKYTDSDGNYAFIYNDGDYIPGKYKLKFTYGFIDESEINQLKSQSYSDDNVKKLKEIIKYNGQDYYTELVGGKGNSSFSYSSTSGYKSQTYAIETIIKTTGKGCAQVFLTIDCSFSMRENKVVINGEEKSRLDAELDAAKELIKSLLQDGTKNIYVGIVAYRGSAYRAASLTNNIPLLNDTIEDIRNDTTWNEANTDVTAALEKCYESYCNNDENSNRYIILLSDGIPTKCKNTILYNNDSTSSQIAALEKIAQNTHDALNEMRQNGIQIYGVFISSGDVAGDKLVKDIFDKDDDFYQYNDFQDILNTITVKTWERIEKSLKYNENIEQLDENGENVIEKSYAIFGVEDEDRRDQVKDYYSEISYKNINAYEAIDMVVNSNNWTIFLEKVADIAKNAYMTASTDYSYELQANPGSRDEIAYDYYEEYNSDGEIEQKSYTYTIHYYPQPIQYVANLCIGCRVPFKIVPTISTTGLRVTASNLQTIQTLSTTEKDLPLISYMEPNLQHGSRVDLEFTITLENPSAIPCKKLSVIVYLPEGFGYSEKLSYITGKKDDNYTIRSSTVEELKTDGLVDPSINTPNNFVVILESKDNFYLGPGAKIETKVMASKLIASEVEEMSYKAEVEAFSYKNLSSRRMQYMGISDILIGMFPGNRKEPDYIDSTNSAVIIPPTGASNDMIYVYMAICSLTILLVGIQYLKSKKAKR